MEAVRISVSPKVISCPESQTTGKMTLSAVAKNGIELRVRAQVTVRTNLNQLIGGATEDTIIARVGQGIISTIGCATTHMDVIATPNRISLSVLESGLDANTAFEIVSIDIAQIDIGENIGARLQSDQAEADMRIARARAEIVVPPLSRATEMKAKLAENHASWYGEAELPQQSPPHSAATSHTTTTTTKKTSPNGSADCEFYLREQQVTNAPGTISTDNAVSRRQTVMQRFSIVEQRYSIISEYKFLVPAPHVTGRLFRQRRRRSDR
jgi:hypothetical protein